MLLSLPYTVLRGVLRLAPAGDGRDGEAEIVLRHLVKVLKRTCRPEPLAPGQAVLRRRVTHPSQGALVKLRRHTDHPAPLPSRARLPQVNPQGQANGKTARRSSGTRTRDPHGEGEPRGGAT
jgi:hypothetical protein